MGGKEAPLKSTFAPKNRRTCEVRGVTLPHNPEKCALLLNPDFPISSKSLCFGSERIFLLCPAFEWKDF